MVLKKGLLSLLPARSALTYRPRATLSRCRCSCQASRQEVSQQSSQTWSSGSKKNRLLTFLLSIQHMVCSLHYPSMDFKNRLYEKNFDIVRRDSSGWACCDGSKCLHRYFSYSSGWKPGCGKNSGMGRNPDAMRLRRR